MTTVAAILGFISLLIMISNFVGVIRKYRRGHGRSAYPALASVFGCIAALVYLRGQPWLPLALIGIVILDFAAWMVPGYICYRVLPKRSPGTGGH